MPAKPTVVLVQGSGAALHIGPRVIVELKNRGYESIFAVENPLTSLADDVERTQKMIKQVDGPVLLAAIPTGVL